MDPKEKPAFTDSAKVDNIKKFLMEFKNKSGHYKYLDKIDSLSGSNVMIEILDLFDFQRESKNGFKIWEYFVKHTGEAIRLSRRAIREVYGTRFDFKFQERDEKNPK